MTLSTQRHETRTATQLGRLVPDASILGEAYAAVRSRDGVPTILGEYGLHPNLPTYWEVGYGQPVLPDGKPDRDALMPEGYTILNIARIIGLEDRHHGAAATLFRRNRIRNFGRSSLELLSSLYERRRAPAKRAVVMYVAQDDYNGSAIEDHAIFEAMQESAPDDTAFELIEIGAPAHTRKAVPCVKSHGTDTKAHTIIMAMHCNRISATLRRAQKMRKEATFDAGDMPVFAQVTDELAIPEATVIMNACSSGRDKGSLAEHINRWTGLKVYAPIEDVAVDTITLKDRRGILIPKVQYLSIYASRTNNSWKSRPTTARRFNARQRELVAPLLAHITIDDMGLPPYLPGEYRDLLDRSAA